MAFSQDLQQAFSQHLDATQLVPPGQVVVVGYSGGADSTCLLHLLRKAGIDVVAAHLNHGQRAEADKEMAIAEAFCQELGVAFAGGRADVPQIAEDHKIGLEEAGRLARYEFFRQVKFRLQADLIATAHTRTDHVETILLNATRGAGLSGLAGIPARRGDLIRPLLGFTREDTRRYCGELGLWTHDDPANSDVNFSRARIRHRVLPELAKINPAVEASLSRLASVAEEEDTFLNGMAAATLEQSELPLNGDLHFLTQDCEVAFLRDRLASFPLVLVRRAIRLAASAVGGELDFDQTRRVVEGLSTGGQGSITAEGGQVVVEWDAERVHVRDLSPTLPFRHNLTVPGETWSDEFGWQFQATPAPVGANRLPRAGLHAEIELSTIKGQLFFRTAQAGDEIQPLGFSGRRKAADLLSEAKLTMAARRRLPLVCDIIGILWMPGVCLSERARPLPGASESLHLRFGPTGESSASPPETGRRGQA